MSEIKIIGRRPNVSERLPKIGPNINCITANILANIPPQTAASATVFPGSTSVIRLGKTGIIIPIPTESRITVKTMIFKGNFFLLIIGLYAIPCRIHAQFL